MKIIGIGNTGAKIALMLNKEATVILTAEQDTNNFKENKNVFSVTEEGASKRFKTGLEIWENNSDRLRNIIKNFKNDYIIVFSAMGGGSGSSALNPVSNILLENNNKVLVIGILPYKGESNPPLANSVQSVNSLLPLLNKITLMLFDNTYLIKLLGTNWDLINKFISQRVDYMINLLEKYNTNNYSPVTLDKSELYSVIFGTGFLDFSNDFLEETFPKFTYSKMDKNAKNCLIGMFVDDKIDNENISKYHNILTDVIVKMSKKIPNSRMIPGILRYSINKSGSADKSIKDRAYFTIVSGLNADNYMKKIEKLKDQAVKKAIAYNVKADKVKLDKKDLKVLDI